MKNKHSWNPFLIVGSVLLLNTVIFLLTAFSFNLSAFYGVALGCVGAGIPLLFIGMRKTRDSMVL